MNTTTCADTATRVARQQYTATSHHNTSTLVCGVNGKQSFCTQGGRSEQEEDLHADTLSSSSRHRTEKSPHGLSIGGAPLATLSRTYTRTARED
jgi:hypothetical protein